MNRFILANNIFIIFLMNFIYCQILSSFFLFLLTILNKITEEK